ncbi:hypothetical protein BV98_002813 [Sphingobium herbicidovorans NBRC 16415]|jgi:hypothetical protein|uniref:Uncharacterized protein n=1 Tax=Sphingobium herbicidovorans (strain ATCC 700291 / DSM 11019 / CCUG 56400 / KCTC 2939 / LMG 18315 / NBRC 16415 / MH) TaxID=1219045 RepID=A0A086P7R1_SPHHM|nr:hypothetical protein [Sphingobium herbicidovorans]KFG89429.1 hypothetical protein BV98_002813 [Sphingobium herbicidovorans NBRC 16415]
MLFASLMLMLAAAPQGDAVGAGRKAFSECLSKEVGSALDKKLSLAGFRSAVKSRCSAREAAFRAAIVADEKSAGMSEQDAQAEADDQIAEYFDKVTEEFEDYSR